MLISETYQPCIGVALDDGGVDGDGDRGASFAVSVEDGTFSDIVINSATIVNAGAETANSATSMMNTGAIIAQSAASAVSGINAVAMVNAGVGVANSVVNAMSGDPLAAIQNRAAVAMSGVRIAASIGNWNEARQKRKESAAQFAAVHGRANPAVNSKVAIATQLDEILFVLSVLGQRLVVLEVINLTELPQAHLLAAPLAHRQILAIFLLKSIFSMELCSTPSPPLCSSAPLVFRCTSIVALAPEFLIIFFGVALTRNMPPAKWQVSSL